MSAPKGPEQDRGTPLSEQLRERFDRATEATRRLIERAQEVARERGFAGVVLGSEPASPSTSTAGSSAHLVSAKPQASSSAEVVHAEPTSMLDREPPPRGYGRPRARALPVDPTTVLVFWEWPVAHFALQPGDVLVLQLVSTRAADERTAGEPLEVTQWAEGLPLTGDYFFRGVPSGAEHRAFIGILREGLFEPVLYTEPVSTPVGEPAPEVAVVRATLVLPTRQTHKPGLVPVFPAPSPPRIVRIEGPAPALAQVAAEFDPEVHAPLDLIEHDAPSHPDVPFDARFTFELDAPRDEAPDAPASPRRRRVLLGSSWILVPAAPSSPGRWPR